MDSYQAPIVTEIGSIDDLTQSSIHKTSGTGDVIVIGSETISIPGGTVTSVS